MNRAGPIVRLRDRVFAVRDRLVTDPRFRRLAEGFPPTRGIARRRARCLFDLCAGFVYSQVLLACVQLRLFDVLADGPQTIDALSARLSLPPESTARLLAAAASLELVSTRGGDRYALGPLGAPLVRNAAVTAMVEHHSALYRDLGDPVALLRGPRASTDLKRYWPYAGAASPSVLERGRIVPYTKLMAASQPLVAEQVLDVIALRRYRCLLDVGGGDGTFVAAAAARAPGLRLMLFDLPAVADRARSRFKAAGLSTRAVALGGDFHIDPLPRGADLVTLVRVLHDQDDADALALLRAVHHILPPDGALAIAEPMADTRGAEPMGAAYFGFYLLAMGRGRPRSPAEIRTMLQAAGFGRVRLVGTRMPIQASVVVATR